MGHLKEIGSRVSQIFQNVRKVTLPPPTDKMWSLDLTESFGFGLESESVAGFDVKSKPNPKIDSYSGSDRIQKSNARTPNLLKRGSSNQQL